MTDDEVEFQAAIQRVVSSPSRKKLVVAGPGTGKTTLFKALLEASVADRESYLVLTFINNLRKDLEIQLSKYAKVSTLHSYCLGLLYQKANLRFGLSSAFRCQPGLAGLICTDWKYIEKSDAPRFAQQMRTLATPNALDFYLKRGDYYDAVDFDDSVFRVYRHAERGGDALDTYRLVMIDEYQDFNGLEAGLIDLLGRNSPILIAGDDDQALYSQLRDSSCDYIRSLHRGGEFEVFELPFCTRCPKVVVEAVNDVIERAQIVKRLGGRIQKPFKHFAPVKGADSDKYPTIALVSTTVQRTNANYMGRYIAEAIGNIPEKECEVAAKDGYPAVLVIVAKPYRPQIIAHLEACDFAIDMKDPEEKLDRVHGLAILRTDPTSNLGWRIILESEPAAFASPLIESTADNERALADFLPNDFRTRILQEAEAWEAPPIAEESHADDGPAQRHVRVTSFEGAKGLSAQHVFIAGLHNGEIPRDPKNVQDLEICRFVVGLTRTRKRCYLICTDRFAEKWKQPSALISWIKKARFEVTRINAAYWSKRQAAPE